MPGGKKMKKSLVLFIILGLVATMFMGCSQDTQNPENNPEQSNEKALELTVAAAASLTDAMKEIEELYKKDHSNTTFEFTFGASGALQSQIEEGAPVDVFLSAAQKQMDSLEEKDMIDKDSRKDLLLNKVVLITPQDSNADIKTFEDISTDKVKKIALGEPESVPVGQYSEEVFDALNIKDQAVAKAVYGTDVRQVLSWVETGEVECGIVYATDAATTDKVEVVTEAPEDSHKPVIYPAALIKDSKNKEAAKSFLDFLSTKEAQEVFEKYGFSTL
jgi:molybdate transport system substrate-binding protein